METFNFPNWDNISSEEQKLIIEMLKLENLISDSVQVVDGDPSDRGLGTKLCKIACDAAGAIAIGYCAGEPICTAAALAAKEICRNNC